MDAGKLETKNCLTCRSRKKGGCDKKRPICGQCDELGLRCEWSRPKTGLTFVYTDPSRPKISSRKSSPAPKGLDSSLARTGYESGYQGVFWNNYLPQGQELPRHVTKYVNGGWTQAIPRICTQSPAVRKIILALCLYSSGNGANRPWEKQEGVRLYAESLRDMAAAMAKPETADLGVLIVTSRLYGIYEIVCGSIATDKSVQAQRWRTHSIGELTLITSRQPETYRSGFLHQVFVDGRFGLVTAAIHMRKRCILSEPSWKTIPWSDIPKTPKDRLMDIFVDLPNVLEEMDIMQACSGKERRELLRSAVINKFNALSQDLANWWTWSNMAEPTDETPLVESISVDNIAELYIMCLYWAACMIVSASLKILIVNDSADSAAAADPVAYCHKIIRATRTLVDPTAKSGWVHLPNFPVATALAYLNATGEDSGAQKRLKIFEATTKSRYGQTVNDFVDSLHRDHAKVDDRESEDRAARLRARIWFGMDR